MSTRKKVTGWRTRLSLAGLLVAWILLALLAFRLVGGQTGLEANQALANRIDAMEQEIENLKLENEALRQEILYRRSDVYLEELARTEMRRVYPGELMVIFPTQDAAR